MRIKERICREYVRLRKTRHAIGFGVTYHSLIRAVFPTDKYPRAFNHSNNGGPPGCAMAFGSALRELGGREFDREVWLPKEAIDEFTAREEQQNE